MHMYFTYIDIQEKSERLGVQKQISFSLPRISVTELPVPYPEPPTRAPASLCPGKTDCVRTCDIPLQNSKCVHEFREINTFHFPYFKKFPFKKNKFLKIIIYSYILLLFLPSKYNSLFTTPSNFFPMVDVDKYRPNTPLLFFFFLHFFTLNMFIYNYLP